MIGRRFPDLSDWHLVCLIGMFLDFDEALSDFEKDLAVAVLGRFDANEPADFHLTPHERPALEDVWAAIDRSAEAGFQLFAGAAA